MSRHKGPRSLRNPPLRRSFRRRGFLTTTALGGLGLSGFGRLRLLAGTPHSRHADLLALRRAILDSLRDRGVRLVGA